MMIELTAVAFHRLLWFVIYCLQAPTVICQVPSVSRESVATASWRVALRGDRRQTPVRSYSTVMHTVMSLQFCRCHGRAMVLEIFGRADYDSVVVDQFPHDQLRALRRPDPDDDK
jgi:hypothetical protein